jgi:fatty-acyl-CoA synthase
MELIESTLSETLRKRAKIHPNREFIVYSNMDLRITYEEFDKRVDNLAKGMLAMGLKKGDHVGIWATNAPDWPTLLFACARAGMVFVTINPNYKLFELEFLVKNADLNALCVINEYKDSDYIEMVNQLIPEIRTCPRGKIESKKFPALKMMLHIGESPHRGMYNITELINIGKSIEVDELSEVEEEVKNDDAVCIIYTSGTTGTPKGVMLTHRNILNNGFALGVNQSFTGRDIICVPVPLSHVFGVTSGLMSILTHGATAAMLETFDVLLCMATIQREKCTGLYGVPTMFIAIMNHPMFNMFNLSTLRTGVMAGATCPPELMYKVMDKMHMTELTIGYGMTETSPAMTQTNWDDPVKQKAETIGRELPEIEVSIRDQKTNKECDVGVQGEICCRGYNVMKGYYKMPEETAHAIDKDGWVHSGDLGVKEEDGYYRIVNRIKDMIIRGGENIYPREIEEYLHTMPGIQDAQVVGIPSKKYGEEVGVFILLRKGVKLTEGDILDFCRGKISRFKIPRYVFFVDEYPLTSSGKVQRTVLKEMGDKMVNRS